jgi:hypothetical protein
VAWGHPGWEVLVLGEWGASGVQGFQGLWVGPAGLGAWVLAVLALLVVPGACSMEMEEQNQLGAVQSLTSMCIMCIMGMQRDQQLCLAPQRRLPATTHVGHSRGRH